MASLAVAAGKHAFSSQAARVTGDVYVASHSWFPSGPSIPICRLSRRLS